MNNYIDKTTAQALCKSNKALLAAIRFRKGAGKGAAR